MDNNFYNNFLEKYLQLQLYCTRAVMHKIYVNLKHVKPGFEFCSTYLTLDQV